jgi:flagellar M-ring protein FliF
LLTPILGTGNFSTEVSADVDFTQTEATRENYDRDGSVLRSEQGGNNSESAAVPARGIPGALSNSVPGSVSASATPPTTDSAPAVPASGPRSENYARNYEIGRAVSVTRAQVGQVRRLSVAVVVRDASLGAARGRPAQVEVLTGLVRSAIGYDVRRGDVVTIAGRAFAPPADEVNSKWYQAPAVQDYTLYIVGLIGAAMLIFGVLRPLLARRRAPTAQPGQVIITADGTVIDDGTTDYRSKLAATRALVSDDMARATVVVRQMIRADAA